MTLVNTATSGPISAPSRASHGALSAAFSAWSGRPWWSHGAAVTLLALVLALRFLPHTLSFELLPDEVDYMRAFERVAEGRSPYRVETYFYPPVVALAGGWLLERLGPAPVVFLLRAANLLGVATVTWCALAWLPWGWRRQVLVGALYLCLAPAVRLGYLWGNLSLAIVGMTVVGLLIWYRRPISAGLLLGSSIVVKPLAPPAVLILAFHRPLAAGRRHLVVAAVAMAVASGLVLRFPYLGEMVALSRQDLVANTVSLHRLPHLLGLRLHPLWVTALVTLAALGLARLRSMGRAHLLCVAVAASVAAAPMVWAHTLLITLPLQVLALQVAAGRRRGLGSSGYAAEARPRRYELIFVSLGVAAIQLAQGATANHLPYLVQLSAVVPAVAPPLLALYLLSHTEPF